MAHLDSERLSAYIDHELSATDMAAVEEHLRSCEICRAEFLDLRALSTLVRELPVYEPTREIDVRAHQRGETGVMATIIAFSKPLAVAAVVLLVAFAGLRLLTNDDEGDSGGQISFSAVQPTETGTESGDAASEEQAADAIGGGSSADPVVGEAAGADSEAPPPMAAEAEDEAPPPMAAMPAREAPPATAVAPPTVETPPAGGEGSGDGWLRDLVVALVVATVAGAAAWYRLVRVPHRQR